MADVHYQGFVPHRPPVPMVRSLSFHGLPTGHGLWQTTASPLDIPGASPPRRSRRLPYLLSVSVPDNADAVLSRSLLEQCRLDSISDGGGSGSSISSSLRSASLKQHGSWASKVFSEVAGSNKASLSTLASSSAPPDGGASADTPGLDASIVGTDTTTFTKKISTEKRPERPASALSAALRRGSCLAQEPSTTPNLDAQRVYTQPDHDDQGGGRGGGLVHYPEVVPARTSGHDAAETVGQPRWQASTDEQPVVPILIPPIQAPSPATSCTGSSTSSTGTGCDWSDTSSTGFVSQSSDQKRALLDRLMEYCYAILANNSSYTDLKGGASTSTAYAPSSSSSSTLSSQRDSGQAIEAQGQSERRAPKSNKRASHHNDSDASGDSDDDEGNNREMAAKRARMEENMGKRLACPFFKRNPQRYQEERSCVGPGWRTVHRLKEHLYRCHTLPIHCLRCHAVFPGEEQLQTHSLSDTPCQRRRPEDEPRTVLEGIGLAQERRLRSRKRTSKTEEDKWRDAYRICFPDDVSVPSPYYEIPALSESITSAASSSGLVQYEDFVRTELPRRVRMELDRRLEQEWLPVEERLRSQLSDMMRDIQLTLLEEFRRRGPGAAVTVATAIAAVAQTESLPAGTSSSTNQPDGTPQRRDAATSGCLAAGASSSLSSSSSSSSSTSSSIVARSFTDAAGNDPSFASPSAAAATAATAAASHQVMDTYKQAVETPGNYASLDTDMPFFGSWDTTSQPEGFIVARDGGIENLNWAVGNDGAFGCFVPDVEDWARSWGNRA